MELLLSMAVTNDNGVTGVGMTLLVQGGSRRVAGLPFSLSKHTGDLGSFEELLDLGSCPQDCLMRSICHGDPFKAGSRRAELLTASLRGSFS
jgi:hypothetical protein